MPEELSSRVLTKTLGGAGVTSTDGETIILAGPGWDSEIITLGAATFALIYNIQKFDLGGYSLQDKTLFPQSVLMQDMNVGPAGGTPANVQRCTVLSTIPLNADAFNTISASTFQWVVPGSNESTFNLQHILSARFQYFLTLTTFAGVQPMKESMYGSGTATAGHAMWYADAYLVPLISGSGWNLALPDQAVVIPALVGKEPELEYFTRLARSLEPVY